MRWHRRHRPGAAHHRPARAGGPPRQRARPASARRRRSGLAGLLVGVAVAGSPAGAVAATPSSPASSLASARGAVISVVSAVSAAAVGVASVNDQQPPPFPVDRPATSLTGYATADLDSSGVSDAVGAAYYPGDGLVSALPEFTSVLCSAASLPVCPAVPDYPLAARASWPTQPQASAPGSTAVGPPGPTGTGIRATAAPAAARAGNSGAAATAAVSEVRAAPATTPLLTVGDASATVSTARSATGIGFRAVAAAGDVQIAGVVRIGGVSTVVTGSAQAAGPPHVQVHTAVTGASVLGVPVTIDDSGVHVAGSSSGAGLLPATDTAVTSALAARGLRLQLLGSDSAGHGHATHVSAGGLVVQYDLALPDSVVPAVSVPGRVDGSVVLAAAGGSIGALADAGLTLLGALPAAAGVATQRAPAGAAGAPPTSGAATAADALPATTAAARAPVVVSVRRSDAGGSRLLGVGLGRWTVPYLVLVGLSVLCLVTVPRVGRRRGGSSDI